MSSVHLEWKTTHVTLIHDADLEIDAFRAIFKNCLTQTNSWLKKNKDDFPIEIFKFFYSWQGYLLKCKNMTQQGHNWIYSILNEWSISIWKLLKKTLILKFLHVCIWIVALRYTCKFPHSISHIFSIGFFLLIAVFSRIFLWHWSRFQGAI